MSDDIKINNIEAFIENVGLSAEADGLPRIAGRMMGYFVVFGGPVSFSELAEHLSVSRGSISTNAKILVNLGVIERTSRPGDRQDYYQLATNPYIRLIEGHVQRLSHMQSVIKKAKNGIPASVKGSEQRIDEMFKFYQATTENMQQLVAEMQANSSDED